MFESVCSSRRSFDEPLTSRHRNALILVAVL